MDLGDVIQSGALGAAKGYVQYRQKENSRQKEMQEEQRKNDLLLQKYKIQAKIKYDYDKKLNDEKQTDKVELERIKNGNKGNTDNTKHLLNFEKEYSSARQKFEGDLTNKGTEFPSAEEWGKTYRPHLYSLAFPNGGSNSSESPSVEEAGTPSPFDIINANIGGSKRVKSGANQGSTSQVVEPAPIGVDENNNVFQLPMNSGVVPNKQEKPDNSKSLVAAGIEKAADWLKSDKKVENEEEGVEIIKEAAKQTGMEMPDKEAQRLALKIAWENATIAKWYRSFIETFKGRMEELRNNKS